MSGYRTSGRLRASALLVVGAMAALSNAQLYNFNSVHRDYEGNQDIYGGKSTLAAPDGSVYVAGTALSDSNGYDVVLIKYTINSSGQFVEQWIKSYDHPTQHGDDLTAGTVRTTPPSVTTGSSCMVLDKDMNIYAAITSASGGSLGNDIVVRKWNPAGDIVWTVQYQNNGDDTATDIAILSDNRVAVSGYSGAIGTNAVGRVVVFKADGSGSDWTQTYGGSGQEAVFNAVATDGSKVFVAGWHGVSNEGRDMLLVRYQGGGSEERVDHYSGPGHLDDEAADLAYTKEGRVVIAGLARTSSYKRFQLVAFDSDGYEWERHLDQNSEAVAVAYNGAHVFATGNDLPQGPGKVITAKVDWSDGALSSDWGSTVITYADPNSKDARAIAIWTSGKNVYVEGLGRIQLLFDNAYSSYLTLVYRKEGGARLEEYYPGLNEADQGHGIASFCAGQIFATGQLYDNDTSGVFDLGTLHYAPTDTVTKRPGLGDVTIVTGTRLDANIGEPAAYEDDGIEYQIQRALDVTGAYTVVVEETKNLGTTDISELCFEVKSRGSTGGILQKVQLFNYDSGQYETFDERAMLSTNRKLHIGTLVDPDPYIDANGNVKVKLKYTSIGALGTWSIYLDLAVWTYLPL